MLKIIYIPAAIKNRDKSLKNFLKCFFYNFVILLRNFNLRKKTRQDTSGYIDAAIHSNAYVVELPYSVCMLLSNFLNFLFDGIFVNWKFTSSRNGIETQNKLAKLSNKFDIKKVIIDNRDQSFVKIEDELLNKFNFVIKREKNVSITNKKYLSTMLPCTLAKHKISKKIEKIDWKNIGYSRPNNDFKYDIYFTGSKSSKERVETYKFIKNKNFNIFMNFERVNQIQYYKNIYLSSINIALAGNGEFTFRHLEILGNCSFMMCDKQINQIELPIPIKDGEHFITYENHNDLLEKINFFLKNKDLRSKIALNGRKQLEKYYSPKNHGKILFERIFD